MVNCDADTLAKNIEELLLSTVQEGLGREKKKKPWVTNDILILYDQRKALKTKTKQKTKKPEAASKDKSSDLRHQERVDRIGGPGWNASAGP